MFSSPGILLSSFLPISSLSFFFWSCFLHLDYLTLLYSSVVLHMHHKSITAQSSLLHTTPDSSLDLVLLSAHFCFRHSCTLQLHIQSSNLNIFITIIIIIKLVSRQNCYHDGQNAWWHFTHLYFLSSTSAEVHFSFHPFGVNKICTS
ncbi:Hypothetical predicted protein [Octopus vulgaris]|uniref:Uncharacterized protein n=1 Tax=Octopus vulgaris TaxID=6645 RepID=A0AA36BK55_OCTVU|nr:Hypothetical predicted protein [Octopus vulgaris]